MKNGTVTMAGIGIANTANTANTASAAIPRAGTTGALALPPGAVAVALLLGTAQRPAQRRVRRWIQPLLLVGLEMWVFRVRRVTDCITAAAAAKINATIQAKRGIQHVDVPPIRGVREVRMLLVRYSLTSIIEHRRLGQPSSYQRFQ